MRFVLGLVLGCGLISAQAMAKSKYLATEAFVGVEGEERFVLKELGSPNYSHRSNKRIFDGAGASLGFRLGVNFGLTIGITGQYGWKGHTIVRTPSDSSVEEEYRMETNNILVGPYVSFPLGDSGLRLLGEYYPLNKAKVTYSNGDNENPFRKGDKMTGNGYALGLGIGPYFNFVFRRREFKDIQTNGVDRSLPDSRFQAFNTHEIVLQVGGGF